MPAGVAVKGASQRVHSSTVEADLTRGKREEEGSPNNREVRTRRRETSVRYGAGRGGFSLCDPAVTPARGQLFAIPPRPV